MATIQTKTLSITHSGNTYVIRGLTAAEVTKLTNAITQQDISGKLDASLKGATGGLAELDDYGKVPSSQLPSYVDDVIEADEFGLFPGTGETGKIYVAKDTNKTYRWTGSTYVLIAGDVVLGETSSTAYRGDRGAAAYAHAVTNKGSAFASGLYKITTNSEGHVTAATAVTKSDITGLGIVELPVVGLMDEGKILGITSGSWTLQSFLGETSSTAYRGDRGASAYTHAVTNKGSAFSSGLYKITTNSEGHVTAATAVVKSDITGLGIVELPAISASDNGSILGVSSGNWALLTLLGETASTAYRGDRGADAYAHAVTNKGSAFSSGLYKITTNSEGHITDAVAVQKSDITALGISDLPAVTASDNGSILGVSNGAWDVLSFLGDTSSTAFRGDYGSAAYAHAVTNKGSAFSSGLYKITTNSEGHVIGATAVVKADITGLGIIELPAISASDNGKLLGISSGEWAVVAAPAVMTGASSSAAGTAGLVPAPAANSQNKYLKGDGTWDTPAGGSSSVMTGATSSDAGTSGAVPAPAAGDQSKYLRGDATWVDPTSNCVKTSGDQVVNGYKTFGYYPTFRSSGSRYKKLFFSNGADTSFAELIADTGDATNITNSQYWFREYSPKSTADTGTTGYYETYKLPACSKGLSANVDYAIVTTKDVDQSIAGVKTLTDTTVAQDTASGALIVKGGIGCAKYIYASRVYNAVFNDYAEFRKAEVIEGGYCVKETKRGIMKKTSKRLEAGCRLTSDTYGSCMGKTDKAKTPIAVAGRVLAYPYLDRARFNIGDAVCSGPDGTVDVMTREEIREYPDRIVGIVSEIPKYKTWKGGTKENPEPVKVNGRIWIYVR